MSPARQPALHARITSRLIAIHAALRPSSIAGIDDVAVRTLSEGLRADFGEMAVPVELEGPEIRD